MHSEKFIKTPTTNRELTPLVLVKRTYIAVLIETNILNSETQLYFLSNSSSKQKRN